MKLSRFLSIFSGLIIILSFLTIDFSHSATEIWKWVDEDGGIHYTDNFNVVPSKDSPSSSQEIPKGYRPSSPSIPPEKILEKEDGSAQYLSLLRELKNYIEKDMERDNNILLMGNDDFSILKASKLLKGDLTTKRELLKRLKKTKGNKIDGEIEWLLNNINAEADIVENMLIGTSRYGYNKAKYQLQQILSEKKKLLDALKDRE